MFIISGISRGLEFWSVNHTSIYKNSKLKVLKIQNILLKHLINWPNDSLGTNLHKLLSLADNHGEQHYNLLALPQ